MNFFIAVLTGDLSLLYYVSLYVLLSAYASQLHNHASLPCLCPATGSLTANTMVRCVSRGRWGDTGLRKELFILVLLGLVL